MFLGENLLAYLVLALGGALAVGNILALIKPPPNKTRTEGDLDKAPLWRSILMISVGGISSMWALASLIR